MRIQYTCRIKGNTINTRIQDITIYTMKQGDTIYIQDTAGHKKEKQNKSLQSFLKSHSLRITLMRIKIENIAVFLFYFFHSFWICIHSQQLYDFAFIHNNYTTLHLFTTIIRLCIYFTTII